MLATVGTVVTTADLSKRVLVDVLLSGVFFAGKVSHLSRITSHGNQLPLAWCPSH